MTQPPQQGYIIHHHHARAATPEPDVRQLIAELSTQITKLTKDMAALGNQHHGRQDRSQSRGRHTYRRSRSASAEKRAKNNPNWLCFYHYKFKADAKKCIEPCNWKNAEN